MPINLENFDIYIPQFEEQEKVLFWLCQVLIVDLLTI